MSSGTWSIAGCERPLPDTSEAARAAGFSNEQGALGGVRFLRNVTGWWLVEQCRQAWGGDVEGLLVAAAASSRTRSPSSTSTTRASSRRPTWPPSCGRHPGSHDAEPAVVIRCAVESMAAATANVVDALPPVTGIRVFGGGSQSSLYLDALRRRSGSARDDRSDRGDGSGQRARPGPRARSVHVTRRCARDTLGPRGGRPVNVQALERLELMRKRLDADGRVLVTELATELDVSEMTVRRDLEVLVDEGVAQRVRGGAVSVGPQQFATRFRQNARAKARIAEKLLDLVGTGGAIGIDASSTLQRLAARLNEARDLTVVTNGPDTFRGAARASGRHGPAHRRRARHPDGQSRRSAGRPRRARRPAPPPLRQRRGRRPRTRVQRVDARRGRRRSSRSPAPPERSCSPSTRPSSTTAHRREPSRSTASTSSSPNSTPPIPASTPTGARPRPVTATSNPYAVEVRSSVALRLRRYRRAGCQADCQSTDDHAMDPGRTSRREDQLRHTARDTTERKDDPRRPPGPCAQVRILPRAP